jgi:hypothetical protein
MFIAGVNTARRARVRYARKFTTSSTTFASRAQAAHNRAASDDAIAKGRMKVTGKKQDVKKVLEILGLKEPRAVTTTA